MQVECVLVYLSPRMVTLIKRERRKRKKKKRKEKRDKFGQRPCTFALLVSFQKPDVCHDFVKTNIAKKVDNDVTSPQAIKQIVSQTRVVCPVPLPKESRCSRQPFFSLWLLWLL